VKTEWDYSQLAASYVKRPDYSPSAISDMVALTGVAPGDPVCDIGAGVAHLTLQLAARRLRVAAVEPNDAMRALGIRRTDGLPNVTWHEGTGEATGQPSGAFALTTFGSSFNVTDRPRALRESARLLRAGGWFACLWNHRDIADPLQTQIEEAIAREVPGYSYGTRREDQTDVINESGLFGAVHRIEGGVVHSQSIEDCLEAWRSHATLQRQVGDRFETVIARIGDVLKASGTPAIRVPYTTRLWLAQVQSA